MSSIVMGAIGLALCSWFLMLVVGATVAGHLYTPSFGQCVGGLLAARIVWFYVSTDVNGDPL